MKLRKIKIEVIFILLGLTGLLGLLMGIVFSSDFSQFTSLGGSALSEKEQKLLNFQRKYSLTESNYVFLMQKRYEADIAIAASVSDISVLDSAKDRSWKDTGVTW